MMDDYMKRVANEYCEAVKIIKQTICEQFTVCPVGAEQVATAILARLAHQKLLLENVDNLNQSEEILDALLRVREDLMREYSPSVYRANFGYIDEALGLSVEELREGK
jgi:hypothetical protein